MRASSHHLPAALLVALAATSWTTARATAQEPVDVTSVVWPTDTSIDIRFTTEPTTALEDLIVQVSSSMEDGTWALFGDVVVTPMGAGAWRALVPAPAGAPRRFFRVVENGIPLVTTGGAAGEGATGLVANLSAPFTGTLGYTIDFSDGSPSQTGTVTLDGATSAAIPVTIPDDEDAETLHYLTVTLTADGDGLASYTLGTGNPVTLVIEDNDALWAGILDADEDDLDLAVTILTTTAGATTTTCFRTDGAGILPPNPNDPEGCWPFATFALDDDAFEASVQVVIPASDTIYGADTHVTVTFTATDPDAVSNRRIDGIFAMVTTVPPSDGKDLSHLAFPPRTGTFTLHRRPAVQPEVEAPVITP